MLDDSDYLAKRFWARVDKTGDCWIWTGGRIPDGYGCLCNRITNGKHDLAHRVSWKLAYGPISDGMVVCHHCDMPACVRPDHLFLGTQADNVADMVRKGRRKGGIYPERLPRGEAHSKARLCESDVLAIRARYAAGESHRALARAFGVGHSTIGQVVTRETWRHVA